MNIWQEAKALPRDRRTLRRFGVLVGGVLLAIAFVLSLRAGFQLTVSTVVVGGIGLLLLVPGLLVPGMLDRIYPLWMALALALGAVMTRVLLTLVFYLVVTPTGLVMRALGKDPMNRTPDPGQETYWILRDPAENAPERMEKPW